MELHEAEAAIQDGATGTTEIQRHVSCEQRGADPYDEDTWLDYSHVSRELKSLAESGDLARTEDGRGYEYSIPTDDPNSQATEAADATGVALPTDYEWDEWVPTGVPEYIATDGEYDEIRAEVDYRQEASNPAHVRLTGPTGAGKTHLPKRLAQERDMPLFDISVKWSIDSSALLGRYVYVNEETRWVNGPLTKALLASQERPVVLLLDEVNRARPEAKAALFEALDDRAQVTLDALGGKTVQGDAMNLIVFSTMNVGSGHVVEELDLAEQRRLGGMWEVNYLGLNHPDREAALLTDRTPVHDGLAMSLVEAANDVRNLAQDTGQQVDRGIPTGVLMQWAASAHKYAAAGLADPVMRAAKAKTIRAFYRDGDRDAPGMDEVMTTLESHVDGVPADAVLEADEWEQWAGETLADELDMGTDPSNTL